MFDINSWLVEISEKCKNIFDENLVFIGYQGSYRRGEATETSDIDMVVVLKNLGINELCAYKKIIKSMPSSDKACGFICSKDGLKNWSKYELFRLYYDTMAIYGDMKELIPEITPQDAKTAAKIGAENIYHFACHSFLYGSNPKEALKDLLKGIVFVIQAKYFFETGEFVLTKKELYSKLDGVEKQLLYQALNKDNIDDFSIEQTEKSYSMLIDFCSTIIKQYN